MSCLVYMYFNYTSYVYNEFIYCIHICRTASSRLKFVIFLTVNINVFFCQDLSFMFTWKNGTWIIHGGTRKITVFFSTFYGVNSNFYCVGSKNYCSHHNFYCVASKNKINVHTVIFIVYELSKCGFFRTDAL